MSLTGSRQSAIGATRALRLGAAEWNLARLVGVAAVVFSAVYLMSDVIEVVQGSFSTLRLSLTYSGEAAIPLFVLGLYAVQRPHIGGLGLLGAVAYAYAYVFFTSTVVYALVAGTANYRALTRTFGGWMTVHGSVMVVGGLAFGIAVVRAGVLPRWTGLCLMAGVVAVAAATDLPTIVRTAAAALPATSFAGMGWATVRLAATRRASLGLPAGELAGDARSAVGVGHAPD